MFKRLEYKITAILSIVVVFCIILVSTITYSLINQSIFNNYVKLSLQYVTQQHQNCQLYMKLIDEKSKLVTNNQTVIDELNSYGNYDSIVKILDGMISANTNIIGISLYSKDGTIYTSSSISNPPTLEYVKNNERVFNFISSSPANLWLVRNHDIMGSYNSMYLNNSQGVYTLVSKIYDNQNRVIGYMFIDTNIKNIYNFYTKSENNSLGTNNSYIMTNDGSILSASYNARIEKSVLNEISMRKPATSSNLTFKHGNYLIVYKELSTSGDVVVIASTLNKIFEQLNVLKIILISISLLFIVSTFFVTRIIAKSISHPLNALYNKMQKRF